MKCLNADLYCIPLDSPRPLSTRPFDLTGLSDLTGFVDTPLDMELDDGPAETDEPAAPEDDSHPNELEDPCSTSAFIDDLTSDFPPDDPVDDWQIPPLDTVEDPLAMKKIINHHLLSLTPPSTTARYLPTFVLAGIPYLNIPMIQSESFRILKSIKVGLSGSILKGDITTAGVFWTRRLQTFLDLKFYLSVSDRVHFISLFWDLISGPITDVSCTDPNTRFLDPAAIDMFSKAAIRLLKKDDLLKPVADQLTFSWRPFHDLLNYAHNRRSTLPRLSPTYTKQLLSLGRLIEYSMAYAPVSTTDEVFNEYFPKLTLDELHLTTIAGAMLNLFLPPQHLSVAQLRTLVHVWLHQFVHMPSLDAMFVDLFTRVFVESQHPHTAWISDQELDFIAMRGLRMLELPVGSSDSGNGSGGTHAVKVEVSSPIINILLRKRNFNRVRIFAKWLVTTLELPNAFDRLQSVILASDTFTHPSNQGSWTSTLAKFIRGIASEFCLRLTASDPEPSESLKNLTRPLVLLLRNPVLCLNHSRDSNAAGSAQGALRYLTAMDASSIMPMLLNEYVYPALGGIDPSTMGDSTLDLVLDSGDGGSHSHRLLASLSALRSTVWALVHPTLWPVGPRVHLAEILQLLLPAIDINDHNKTLHALLFISNVHACVPVNGIAGFVQNGGADDWVTEFLSRVFTLLENLDASGPSALQGNASKGKEPSGIEGNLVQAIVFAVGSVVELLSPELFKQAAQRTLNWARSYTLLHIGDAVAQLAHVIILRDPLRQLPLWLVWLVDVISDEIEHGAGMRMTIKVGQGSAEQGTVTLIKYLNIVGRLALAPGQAILATRDQWDQILTLIFPLRDRDAFRLAHRTLANLTVTLTSTYPLDTHVPGWPDHDAPPPWMARGEVFPKPADLTYSWHSPSKEEITLAKKWVNKALESVESNFTKMIGKVSNVADDSMDVDVRSTTAKAVFTSFEDQHAWIKSLSLVTWLLSATSAWESLPDEPQSPVLLRKRQILLHLGEAVSVDNVRSRMVALLMSAWGVFRDAGDARITHLSAGQLAQSTVPNLGNESSNNNPHISILISLIGATQTYLNTGRRSSTMHAVHYQSRRALFRMPSGLAMGPAWDENDADAGRQLGPKWTTFKSLPRALHERRVHLIHMRRAKHNTQHVPLPAQGAQFVDILRPHTLSNYTGVRRSSQGCVLTVLGQHPKQRQEYIGWVLFALARLAGSPVLDKHDRAGHIRAGLSAIRSRCVIRGIAQKPQWTCPFARALLRVVKYEDDPRLVNMAHLLTVSYLMAINPAPFRFTHVATAVDRATNLQWRPPTPTPESELTGNEPSSESVKDSETKPDPNSQTPEEKTAILQDAFDKLVRLYWSNGNSDFLDVPAKLQDEGERQASAAGMETDLVMDVTKVAKMHWRMFGTLISLASALTLRSDIQLSPAFMSMLMTAWVHPHPHIQKAGETVLLQIQARLKYRSGPTPSKKEIHVDQDLAQYLRDEKIDLSSNSASGSAPNVFIHASSSGWLCFRNTVKVYQVNEPAGARHSAEDAHLVDAIRQAFSCPEWVEKLFHYQSLDQATQPGQMPNFHWSRANQVRHMFVVMGPEVIVDAVLPFVLQKLQASSDKPADLSCGLEWASALLRGCKHWDSASTGRVWEAIVPEWASAMRLSGPDTFRLFYMALRFVLGNRDPRATQPLIQEVLALYRELETGGEYPETDVGDTVAPHTSEGGSKVSAFGIAKRLVFQRALVESLGHRGTSDVVSWTSTSMVTMLKHPYKLVRDTISSLVAESISWTYRPFILDTRTFIELVDSGNETMKRVTLCDTPLTPARELVDQIMQLPVSNDIKEQATQAYKSIAVITISLASTARAQLGRMVLEKMIPLVFQLMTSDDTEAVDLASGTLTTAAHFDLGSSERVSQFVTNLMRMVQSEDDIGAQVAVNASTQTSSWQIKLRILRYIQIVYYRHLPALADGDRVHIVHLVANMLIDGHVEVRTLAGITLAGLIQCSGGVVQSTAGRGLNVVAQAVNDRADQMLKQGVLPKRKPGQPQPDGFAAAIRYCHGGVLALAALIRSHPYTVVPFVPKALIQLAAYAEYPVPIGTSVKALFAEFKRTHADSWHLDMMAFDEDQRAVMANMLVSPSYYA